MLNRVIKKSLLLILIIAVAAAVFAYPLFDGLAYGIDLGGTNTEELWYYGNGGLKVGDAKQIVSGWNKSLLTKKVIAVIDTGIDSSHELFDGLLYTNADGNAVGYDARKKQEVSVENLKDSSDDKHGNAIAGVVATLIRDFGLQDLVRIYVIKANSIDKNGNEKNTFAVSTVVEAIKRASDIGADAVNMSFGTLKGNASDWANSKDLQNAIMNALQSSVLAAAAGNNGLNSDEKDNNVFYPAGHDGVLGVMAYDLGGLYTGENGGGSNYGSAYDIAAPGEGIFTAKYTEGTKYQQLSGTSLASPMVAFASVLLKMRYEAESKNVPNAARCSTMLRYLAGRTVSKDQKTYNCLDFATLLTQDFEETDYNYLDPEKIELSHNGTLGTDTYAQYVYMNANDVKAVTFVAKLYPFGQTDPVIDASIQWVLRTADGSETTLGHGTSYTLVPEKFGDTSIIARLHYGAVTLEAEQKIHVEYSPYLVGDVRVTYADRAHESVDDAPGKGVLYTTETTLFALTGLEYVDKTVPIKWYVDGEYAGEGLTFAYTPKTAGVHRISAKYGDMPATNTDYVFVAEVKSFIARPFDLAMLVIGLAVLAVGVSVGVSVAVKRKKSKIIDDTSTEKE